MSIGLYNTAQIRKLQVNGVDQRQNIREVYTGTSIFTPYQFCRLTFVDASLIQDALYESGAPVKIVYSAGDASTVREYEFVTMSRYDGGKINANRAGDFSLLAINLSYFNLNNEHTSYHQNITASEAIKKLHKEVDSSANLNVTKSKGMIADIEPFHLRAIKLGKGVDIIRNRMTDEKYNSGAYTYFRDQNGDYWAKPIEELFDNANGPIFTQHVAGSSLIRDQRMMAKNIFSIRKISSDDVNTYADDKLQRGGTNPNLGMDMSTVKHETPVYKEQALDSRKTPGTTRLNPEVKSNKFNSVMRDRNQKKQDDYEGSIASKNVMTSIATQGMLNFNIPLEGAIECLVGKGCYVEMPSEVGDQKFKKSSDGQKQLILAQGEYLKIAKDNQMRAFASLMTSSGGKQGEFA